MHYILRKIASRVMTKVIANMKVPETEIIEGFGTRELAGKVCKDRKYHSAFIVTDKNLRKLGLLEKLTQGLDAAGISYEIYDSVLPDPTMSAIEECLLVARKQNADCVIAMGGGSVMDTAKMASAGLKNKTATVKDLCVLLVGTKKGGMPLITIPSTAGTGSEVTYGAVISDDKTHKKSIVGGPSLQAVAAILDGDLTLGCPASITASTGFDALSHGIECYLSEITPKGTHEFDSLICVKLAMENLPKVYKDGSNREARINMCRAANLGGMALNRQMAGIAHAFGHEIGARFHYPHGESLSIALPKQLRYQKDVSEKKLAQLAIACGMGESGDNRAMLAEKFIQRVESLITELGLPTSVPEMTKEDYPEMLPNIIGATVIKANAKVMTKKDALEILNQCSKGLNVGMREAYSQKG